MNIIFLLIGLAVGGGGIYAFFHMQGAKRLQKIQAENEKEVAKLEKHLKDLELKSATIETKIREKILDAKNKAFDIINEAKQDETERRKQLEKQEQRLISKEDLLEKKVSENEKVREDFAKKLEAIKMEEEKLEAIYKEQEVALSKITNMTTEEAREILLKNVERDYQAEIVAHYKKMEGDIKEDAAKKAKSAGIEQIIIDPGIGFGKKFEHNIEILRSLDKFKESGYPLMVGLSRKSFINGIYESLPSERLEGTLVSNAAAVMKGANILRVHDVLENKRAAITARIFK